MQDVLKGEGSTGGVCIENGPYHVSRERRAFDVTLLKRERVELLNKDKEKG